MVLCGHLRKNKNPGWWQPLLHKDKSRRIPKITGKEMDEMKLLFYQIPVLKGKPE